jgi:hypothetical protein
MAWRFGAFRCSLALLNETVKYPVKISTNLCGLAVVPDAQNVLKFLYEKMLKELQIGCKF